MCDFDAQTVPLFMYGSIKYNKNGIVFFLWGTLHNNTIVTQNVLWKTRVFLSQRTKHVKMFQQIWPRRFF